MSSLKTFLTLCAFLVGFLPAANAMPGSASDRVYAFADCAGRLSALEESQRLFDGALSEKTAKRRAMFSMLIDATLPDARLEGLPGRRALHWQVEAKMAQAVLLQQAVFATDPAQARRASQAANSYLTTCDRLLLGS